MGPIIEILMAEFGATKVILFSSLVKSKFREASDLALAVAGLATLDYFPAWPGSTALAIAGLMSNP
ncbi:MAG: hypothetical protein HC890_16850 [Chloroflexaceae bacterium]|nr:hypothetical protein [Chloroflexaceae bacterium]